MSLLPIYGAGYTILNRLWESNLSDSDAEWVDRLRDQIDNLEDWVRITEGLEIDDPVSWARTGVKTAAHLLDIRKIDAEWNWAAQMGFHSTNICPSFGKSMLHDSPDRQVALSGDNFILYRIPLTEDYEVGLSYFPSWDNPYRLYIPEGTEKQAKKHIRKYLWNHWNSQIIGVDYLNNAVTTQEMDLDTKQYYGPLGSLVEVWEKYLQHEIQRNILLHGPIGTGKSTLALEAARRLSQRTLFLRQDFCLEAPTSTWERLLDILKPKMVVMDEIDKIGAESLGSRLKMFEEGYCDVPLVIMTSNDLSEIPQPMLRPGRIDQTIEVNAPSKEHRKEIILDLADREGVDIPSEYLDGSPEIFDSIGTDNTSNLVDLIADLSAAHVVEFLRRYKVEGESWVANDQDITFDLLETESTEGEDTKRHTTTMTLHELAEASIGQLRKYDGIKLEEQ